MNEIMLKPTADFLNFLESISHPSVVKTKEWITFSCLHKLYISSKRNADTAENGQRYRYLHEWLESCELHYPSPVERPRDQVLEARVQKLRAQQDAREYRRMTANVQAQNANEGFSIGEEVRSLKSQMFAVMNFLLTVGGTFVFGYKAVEYSSEVTSLPMQILVGFVMATIVALAELYFVAKLI